MSVTVHQFAVNPGPLGSFMRKLRTQRGHMAILGNSNEFQNTGSAAGRLQAIYIKAAAAGIPIYASPPMTLAGINGSTGAPAATNGILTQSYPDIGHYALSTTSGNYGEAAYVKDPLNAANTAWLPLGLVHKWGSPQSAGTSYSTSLALHCMSGCDGSHPVAFSNNGMYSNTISPSDPNLIQWAEKFRGEFWCATKTPAGGTLRPAISVNNALTAQASSITVASGTPTWRDFARYKTTDVAAGSRAGTVKLGFSTVNGTAPTGDIALSYFFVVHPDRDTGLCIGCPWAVGGASPLDVAYSHYGATRATPDETIYHYLQAAMQMVADKDQEPIFCLVIADTLNMRNETATTAWNVVADADSAEAYATHCAYIINRWKAVWNTLELVGSDGTTVIRTKEENFTAVSALDHPISVPDDAEHILYRETGGALLANRMPETVTALRMDNIIDAETLYATNSNAGYQPNTTKTANAITTGSTTTITTTATHGLVAGQFVTLSGTNSTPNIDGRQRVVSVPTTTTFTVTPAAPVTVAGTTGTVTIKDTAHLTKEGYEEYATQLWRALLTLPPRTSGTARLRGR